MDWTGVERRVLQFKGKRFVDSGQMVSGVLDGNKTKGQGRTGNNLTMNYVKVVNT
jgi:hypothetical protein